MHNPETQQQLQHNQRIHACTKIVDYDARSVGQAFQAAHRRRLHHIESTKKYKAREQRLPHYGTRNQRDQLPRDFVNYDVVRVFFAAAAFFQGCRWNSDGNNDHDQQQDNGNSCGWRQV